MKNKGVCNGNVALANALVDPSTKTVAAANAQILRCEKGDLLLRSLIYVFSQAVEAGLYALLP